MMTDRNIIFISVKLHTYSTSKIEKIQDNFCFRFYYLHVTSFFMFNK
jgi:hypothetical protein